MAALRLTGVTRRRALEILKGVRSILCDDRELLVDSCCLTGDDGKPDERTLEGQARRDVDEIDLALHEVFILEQAFKGAEQTR
jgi:hypothetical protein